MGYITLIVRGKKVIDFTDEHDSRRQAEDDAVNIVKSLTRGQPYKLITKDTNTGEQVGKTRRIQGEKFNPKVQSFEEAVNYYEGYKTTREGREPINAAERGLEINEDPRWSV